MNVGIVGCGYVADMYASTLAHHGLKLISAYDRDRSRMRAFTRRWPGRRCIDLDDFLDDPDLELVLNLTNPRSHLDITRQALEAGKHVYSEKPLGMTVPEARQLIELARQRRLGLASAPCSLLGPTAQTLFHAVRSGTAGRVRLVYASFDDGMIAPNRQPWRWRNGCGIPWPAKDEFEVGCTFEHAGYVLTWLAAMLGPARRVNAYSACLIADKGIPVDRMAPDFSVGCIEYDDGIVARVTCGLVAPKDKSLMVVGDRGVLSVSDLRDDAAPVYFRPIPSHHVSGWIERKLSSLGQWTARWFPVVPWKGTDFYLCRRVPFVVKPSGSYADRKHKPVDFCRGPAELASAIAERRACRLSPELGVHVVELIEAIQFPDRDTPARDMHSTFDPIAPLVPELQPEPQPAADHPDADDFLEIQHAGG
jgi:predicted dehydrogenase